MTAPGLIRAAVALRDKRLPKSIGSRTRIGRDGAKVVMVFGAKRSELDEISLQNR